MSTKPQPAGTQQPRDIAPLSKLAIITAFVSFVVPFIGSIAAFLIAIVAKLRLPDTLENRTDRGIATIAQVTAVLTAVMYGAFFWYAETRWGQ